MMKKTPIIVIFIAVGCGGYYLYKQYGIPTLPQSLNLMPPTQLTKCITKDGNVIYGSVPDGIVCEKTEPVKGSMMVLPRKDFIGQGNDK